MRRPIRVAVADDHPVYRRGVKRALESHPDVEVVGEAADGREALALIEKASPEVALLDLRMPELDGRAVLAALKRAGSETRVIFLSGFLDAPLVHDALAAGAAGYISKEAEDEELCRAVLDAAHEETVVSPQLHGSLVEYVARQGSSGAAELSERELEALKLVAEGRTIAEIGAALHLAESTVKTYLRRAYGKLDASKEADAVAEAMRRGLLR